MTFVLDSSVLGGAGIAILETPIEERGRTTQIQWLQGGLDQDMELFGYSIRYAPAETDSAESI